MFIGNTFLLQIKSHHNHMYYVSLFISPLMQFKIKLSTKLTLPRTCFVLFLIYNNETLWCCVWLLCYRYFCFNQQEYFGNCKCIIERALYMLDRKCTKCYRYFSCQYSVHVLSHYTFHYNLLLKTICGWDLVFLCYKVI